MPAQPGVIHYHRLELDEALDCAGRALRIDPSLPGAHFVRAETLLLRGEWAEGWEEYEWRFRIGGAAPLMPPTSKPQWDGSALRNGTLLLIADQGFGDVIQFARYIPWAAERCRDIAIAGSTEVRPLLRQIAPAARQFVRWEDAPDFAAYCPLSGLPRLVGTRIDNVPAPIPYLRADPARVRAVGAAAGWLGAAWLPPRRRDLGRASDTQQRSQSLGAAGGFPAAGQRARGRAAGVAEGAEDRPGRRRIMAARR